MYHDEEWLAVHFCLHHTRVFYAARPLVLLRDGRLVGVHDGRWRAIVHAQAILAFHQAYSRCSLPDAGIGVVFSPVEHTHLAVLHHCCWIERIGALPFHLCLLHRAIEEVVRDGLHHRVFAFGANKAAYGPIGQNIIARKRCDADKQEWKKVVTSHGNQVFTVRVGKVKHYCQMLSIMVVKVKHYGENG